MAKGTCVAYLPGLVPFEVLFKVPKSEVSGTRLDGLDTRPGFGGLQGKKEVAEQVTLSTGKNFMNATKWGIARLLMHTAHRYQPEAAPNICGSL